MIISLFPNSTPDWVFDITSITVSGANVTQNIKAVCTGDVNTSLTPVKSQNNEITLLTNGIIKKNVWIIMTSLKD